ADYGMEVEERKISIDEILVAHQGGQLLDAFGVGTAATIAPIELIGYNDDDLILPPVENRTLSKRISEGLKAIRYGEVEDKFGWMVSMN
ncbi:MAG: branched chain amino acid aminotransferase, partial [Flavobacteriales bacterium]